jgi:hypothetical protein
MHSCSYSQRIAPDQHGCFPLLVCLIYDPGDDNTEGLEKTDAAEEAEVEEKIDAGFKEGGVK